MESRSANFAGIRPVKLHSTAESGENDDDKYATESSPLLPERRITSTKSAKPPASLFLHGISSGRFWIIFSQTLTAQFIGCFDATIMASSHPVITSYFDAANSASWLSVAFLLTSTAFQPLLGRLSDAIGRKTPFIGCLVLFTAATIWCAAANSIGSFIFARAVCGLGAGGAMTLGTIVLSDLVPVERRGYYQPYVNICYGVGCSLGAALGGVMCEALGWRWEFGVQVPLLLLCLGISVVAIPDDLGIYEGRKSILEALYSFDMKGSILLIASVTFLILGLNIGGNVLPWSHPLVITSLIMFAGCLPLFLWVESRVANPIIPLELICHRPRANLLHSNFIAAFLTNSMLFNMPLFYQAVLLSSATSSGLRLMLPSVITSISAALTSVSISWTRRLLWPLFCGSLSYSLGYLLLSLLRKDLSPILCSLVLIPTALGHGFQFPGVSMALYATSTQAEQAVVTSTMMLWRSLGMVFGIATSSLIVQNALVHYLDKFVHGERRLEVISLVRASVEAIGKLESPYQEQVVQSYESALRLMFICGAIISIFSILFILPLRLPRLTAKET